MNENIKRFNSHSEYENWKAKDGWDYPNVSFIDSSTEQAIYYNNEFIMRWSIKDNVMTPTFLGDISHEEFKAWVDQASQPCEIKKDGTDFAYLKPDDLTATTTGAASHYGADYPDYLQFSEIENVNVGLFQNTKEGWCEVRFNFDKGCPKGFHKWFAHPYWNETKGKYTKLIGRYNIIPVDTVSTIATNGITINAGFSMSPTNGSINYEKGNLSANAMLSGIKATLTTEAKDNGMQLLEITYWEYLVMSYIFAAYFKTFDTQSIAKGLQADSTNFAGNRPNGEIDQATTFIAGGKTSHFAVAATTNASNEFYKFLWLDMPLHGQQWIWGAGFVGNSSVTPGQYWMTFNDIKANEAATMNKNNADVIGHYPPNQNGVYIKYSDLFGVPQVSTGASSSTGLFDGFWSTNLYDSRIAYLGGSSYDGAICGSWARFFFNDAGYAYWNQRGRATMVR